jgi:hypothetical protein
LVKDNVYGAKRWKRRVSNLGQRQCLWCQIVGGDAR